MVEDKIRVTILANTCGTRYSFIDEEFIEKVYQILEIKLQCLIKLKHIQEFDDRAMKFIIRTIYSTLTIGIYIENLTALLITKLEVHPIIFN